MKPRGGGGVKGGSCGTAIRCGKINTVVRVVQLLQHPIFCVFFQLLCCCVFEYMTLCVVTSYSTSFCFLLVF